MTFASEPEMQRHLVTGKHLTKANFDKEPGGQAATAGDVMKKKWLEGLSGQVAGRKRGNLSLNYTRTFFNKCLYSCSSRLVWRSSDPCRGLCTSARLGIEGEEKLGPPAPGRKAARGRPLQRREAQHQQAQLTRGCGEEFEGKISGAD